MTEALTPAPRTRGVPVPVEARFVLSMAAIGGVLTSVSVTGWPESLTGAGGIPLLAFAAGSLVAGVGLRRTFPHARLGACNIVTHLRLALVSLLTAPMAVPGALSAAPSLAWVALGLAVAAMVLDGIDGYLARRSGLVSAYGARFDVEVDAALALVLAVLVWQTGKAGPWVLALGAVRYAFVGGTLVLPWLREPLPPRFRRKVVCVVQLGALTALMAPPVVPPLSTGLAAVAAILLAWSFAMDVAWLRTRARG